MIRPKLTNVLLGVAVLLSLAGSGCLGGAQPEPPTSNPGVDSGIVFSDAGMDNTDAGHTMGVDASAPLDAGGAIDASVSPPWPGDYDSSDSIHHGGTNSLPGSYLAEHPWLILPPVVEDAGVPEPWDAGDGAVTP